MKEEKGGTTTVGTTRKDFCWNLRRKGENASSLVGFFLGVNTAFCVSASVPVRLSLGGSKKKLGSGSAAPR